MLIIDWIKRQTTEKHRDGIQWTLVTEVDVDFADDVALFSNNHQDMHSKLTRMGMISERAGLRINKSKTKGIRINTANADRLELDGEEIDEMEDFANLGINISMEVGQTETSNWGSGKRELLS